MHGPGFGVPDGTRTASLARVTCIDWRPPSNPLRYRRECEGISGDGGLLRALLRSRRSCGGGAGPAAPHGGRSGGLWPLNGAGAAIRRLPAHRVDGSAEGGTGRCSDWSTGLAKRRLGRCAAGHQVLEGGANPNGNRGRDTIGKRPGRWRPALQFGFTATSVSSCRSRHNRRLLDLPARLTSGLRAGLHRLLFAYPPRFSAPKAPGNRAAGPPAGPRTSTRGPGLRRPPISAPTGGTGLWQ